MFAKLLAQKHLSIISSYADAELGAIRAAIPHAITVDGRADLELLLGRLLDANVKPTPKTLDLIGHTTTDKSLLVLGDWLIDATNSTVLSFFRGLADQDVPRRLGIEAVRLLGCTSADTAFGRWTVCALADVLGIDVYGTTGLLLASHYDAQGFRDEARFMLASAAQLRTGTSAPRALDRGARDPHVLDLDSLPAATLPARRWPVRVPDRDEAKALLRLIRRRDASVLPGLHTAPSCELAFPAGDGQRYYLMQVLLDSELVRVYPAGLEHGLVYPVDDPYAFGKLITQLAAA
ncbi:MAG TPA: hypothetical protein VLT45_23000 [Kofleriaceae bacterium]|nr:hypothetical protein [Kofleriaceae bacterium]